MKAYRIAIVEPAEVVGEGIAAMLSRSADTEVVLLAKSLAEVAPRVRIGDIDALFVSVGLTSQLDSYSELDNLVLIGIQSALTDSNMLARYASVVTIYSTEQEVMQALGDAMNKAADNNHADSHELSERERDVLVLVAQGYTNKEIATELNISPHTVISHRKNIVYKTGIRSVAGLTVYAVLNKLINSEK